MDSSSVKTVNQRHHISGDVRCFTQTLSAVVSLFNACDIDIALVGCLAYGFYADAKYTDDIDVVVSEKYSAKLKDILLLEDAAVVERFDRYCVYRLPESWKGIAVDIHCLPEERAKWIIGDVYDAVLFGVPIKLAKPEQLVSLLLSAQGNYSHIDAMALLESGKVNVDVVKHNLADKHKEIAILNELLEEIQRPKCSYTKLLQERALQSSDVRKEPVWKAIKNNPFNE